MLVLNIDEANLNFKLLNLKETYATAFEDSNVVDDFYTPVLEKAVSYDRAAGYFSSRAFVAAASGIAGLVQNGGKMRLVTSHAFTKSDVAELQEYFSKEEGLGNLYKSFYDSVNQLQSLGNEIAENHLKAMCWMLREGYLEVKIVIPLDADLSKLTPDEIDKFHPKFGIMKDADCNKIAFSGSINETLSAWNLNVENFDVYRSWESGQEKFIDPKEVVFEKYWIGQNRTSKWRTISLPEAVKEKIIDSFAPTDFPEYSATKRKSLAKNGEARSYQPEAAKAWVDNNYQGVLEMATGTGKTRTAKLCIDLARKLGTLLTIVVVPYRHIGTQWLEELKDYSSESIGGANWVEKLEGLGFQAALGRTENLTLIVVKNTGSSAKFIRMAEELASNFDNTLLVGDEVHWLGATAFQSSMVEFANLRLGLSATPSRYFDDLGTDEIFSYFGSKSGEGKNQPVYKFDIKKALAFRTPNGTRILTPYRYNPEFVKLTQEEQQRYLDIYLKIIKLKNSINPIPDKQKILESLYINLADIAKSAENKIEGLRKLLTGFTGKLDQCLIYCSDLTQMDKAAEVLKDMGIDVQRITSNEDAHESKKFAGKSERQHILDNFEKGVLHVLLAVDCLDEGVDIPSARIGIILASSGNSKEFIQRRGRLMRVHPGKDFAEIYDFCVLPDVTSTDAAAKKIIGKEIDRIREFADDAENGEEILEKIQLMIEDQDGRR